MAKPKTSARQEPASGIKKTIRLIADLALDKKAEEIVVLNVRKVANFCDYFMICSGTSDRHVKTIAENIHEGLEKTGRKLPPLQGSRDGHWVIIDAGDVVVHVFDKDTREFYGLEHLWQAGKKIDWK